MIAQDFEAEVAPGFGPFVVLFGQYGSDKSDQCVAVGEDAGDVYFIGLSALQWDANAISIDVTLADMMQDSASGTTRDVGVTITVDAPDAFKGAEIKQWESPLA